MKRFVKSRSIFILMVFLCTLLTFSATWVVELIGFPMSVSRLLAILVYLPFACLVLTKVCLDIRHWRSALTVSNGFFYAFAVYYAALFGYRFLRGMEIKEHLYYSIVFFGAISLYMLLRDRFTDLKDRDMAINLIWIALFFVVYRLLYCAVGARFLEFSPINVNLTSGAVALLMPLLSYWLTSDTLSRKQRILCWITLTGGVVVIATTGARALFWLSVITVGVILLSSIFTKSDWIRLTTAVVAGCLIVVGLCLGNVGRTRYAVYRETGLTISLSSPSNSSDPDNPDEEEPDEDQLAAQEQVDASNQMRSELVAMGVEQMQLNPWFGTGDVLYVTYPRPDFKAVQSSHNFLIEAIICYGVFGLIMIAGLFISLIGETGLFVKMGKEQRRTKIVLLLTLFFYFAFGFVQPTVFNPIICLLFVMAVAAVRGLLQQPEVQE